MRVKWLTRNEGSGRTSLEQAAEQDVQRPAPSSEARIYMEMKNSALKTRNEVHGSKSHENWYYRKYKVGLAHDVTRQLHDGLLKMQCLIYTL